MAAPLIALLIWPVSRMLPQALKPYQVEGVRWCYKAIHRGGGLLADDPGLGKTLQVIAAVEAAVHAKQVSRVLIAAPANLLANWDAEFRHWLGGTEHALAVTHLKKGTANLAMPIHLELLARTKLPHHCVTLVSYEGLLKHGKYLAAGDGVDLLICDEAHGLAHMGVRATAVRSVPAKARLLITATPLSNDMEELYRLYNFAVPGVLGTLSSFRYDFLKPIEAASAEGAGDDVRLLGKITAEALSAVSARVQIGSRTRLALIHPQALTMPLPPYHRCSSDVRARHSTEGCPPSIPCSSCVARRQRSDSWSPCLSQRAPPRRATCCRLWDASIPRSWIHRCNRSSTCPHHHRPMRAPACERLPYLFFHRSSLRRASRVASCAKCCPSRRTHPRSKWVSRIHLLSLLLTHPVSNPTNSVSDVCVHVHHDALMLAPRAAWSGKLQACARLLDVILRDTPDKVVVVCSRLNVLRRIRGYVESAHEGGKEATFYLNGDLELESRQKMISRYAKLMADHLSPLPSSVSDRHGHAASLQVQQQRYESTCVLADIQSCCWHQPHRRKPPHHARALLQPGS